MKKTKTKSCKKTKKVASVKTKRIVKNKTNLKTKKVVPKVKKPKITIGVLLPSKSVNKPISNIEVPRSYRRISV